MAQNLTHVTRAFGRGEATLETLRAAARAERGDRRLAETILQLITDWENSGWTDSEVSRTQLRIRVKQLVPAAPTTPPASTYRRDPSESLYAAGLRGQKRRG